MAAQPSKVQNYVGIALTVIPSLLLLFSASMKLTRGAEFLTEFSRMGFPEGLAIPLGIIEALSTLLFLIPKTSFLGAILLTGYMGGAICTHLRLGDPVFVQVAIGVVIWAAYGLRRPNVIRSAF